MTPPAPGFREITTAQLHTLVAAGLGWMLDAFDVMLYSLVLASVMVDLGMTKAQSGFLNTLTLVASGIGGVLFGFIADRIGRKKALMLSILTYSLCSLGSGFSTSVAMLAAFRFVLGLGMGGEWNTGATLVAETWPAHLRAKAIAIVQSSWAIGFALAALVVWIVTQFYDWRTVFFVGVLPALVILWIRRDVPESEMWGQRHAHASSAAEPPPPAPLAEIFSRPFVGKTFALLFLNFFGMFAWWGLLTWVPAYLALPVAQGGRGFSESEKTLLLVILNLTGLLPGNASFGWVADLLGRRRAFMLYTFLAAVLVPLYAMAESFWTLLLLGTPVAFFGTGFFSGSGIIGSEIFPTRVRARALGFTYNGARTLSSVSPFVIGWAAETRGLGGAFMLCAASFLLASLVATRLPETRGKELD
ncbi:MAG TPA: MFS transporter [Terriglobales bacterium]|nr:MFS transporter [Terriglobales bacterium]